MASGDSTNKKGVDGPTSGFPIADNVEQSQDVLYVRKKMQEEVDKLATQLEQELGYTNSRSIKTAEHILLRGGRLQDERFVQQLAKELVENKICSDDQSRNVAKDIVLQGGELTENGPGDGIPGIGSRSYKWFQEKIQQPPKYKMPNVLFIMSLIKPVGSKRRENEEKQRKSEALALMETWEINVETYGCCEFKTVMSYDEMLEEITAFVRDRNVSELPFVLFLGHGTPDGELCFSDRSRVHCRDALDKVAEIFENNRPPGMASSQLRFVFSQCHGHKVDSKKDRAGKVRVKKIEYVYVTSSDHPENFSHKTSRPPNITQIQKMADPCDVYLQLDVLSNNVAITGDTGMITQLKQTFPALKDPVNDPLDKKLNKKIKEWLWDGPPKSLGELPEEMGKEQLQQDKIQSYRKKLKMFLQLSYSVSANESTDIEEFRGFTIPPFECHKKHVTSKDQLYREIDSFLDGAAHDVVMPVVLVKGRGTVDESDKLVLHIDTDDVPVDEIHDRFRHVLQIRFVFLCGEEADRYAGAGADDSSNVLFSNALQLDLTGSKILELDEYALAIIGDGPKNKIKLPKPVDSNISPITTPTHHG